ncbi:MAG TPA: alpha/beta fold hydrolase [Candidatus Cryosericum sp.]|nr:alpha/beta fold hydrolase [Candidatus Cryosericum sp.]
MKQADTTKRNAKPAKRRVLRAVLIGLIILISIPYFLYPAGMGLISSFRAEQSPEPPPEGYAAVTLTASDGAELACWYAPGENGASIILIHGSNGNLVSLRSYAAFLREAGFGVLALTLRGHSGSGGNGNAFGWECGADVTAAVQYLTENGCRRIGALGLSLGGEVLLSSADSLPEIAAVAADGATHHSLADYLAPEWNRSLWRSWTARVLYASAALFTGQKPPESSIAASIAGAQGTRFLLIAAGSRASELEFGQYYTDLAGGHAELWIVPEAGHTQGYTLYPDEYARCVTAFFNDALLQDSPAD